MGAGLPGRGLLLSGADQVPERLHGDGRPADRAAGFQVDLVHQVSRIVAAEVGEPRTPDRFEAISTRVTEVDREHRFAPFWFGNHCASSHRA
jgi:hypothetical protein